MSAAFAADFHFAFGAFLGSIKDSSTGGGVAPRVPASPISPEEENQSQCENDPAHQHDVFDSHAKESAGLLLGMGQIERIDDGGNE